VELLLNGRHVWISTQSTNASTDRKRTLNGQEKEQTVILPRTAPHTDRIQVSHAGCVSTPSRRTQQTYSGYASVVLGTKRKSNINNSIVPTVEINREQTDSG
jgi:hypothetical protein